MFAYYFQLGLRSLRRNPALTALMVMAIGFGVAASMITYSVFRAVSGNPIPEKSTQLFTPQIDSWGPQQNLKGEPPEALNYVDAMALMHAHQAKRQTLLYPIQLSVLPSGSRGLGSNGTENRDKVDLSIETIWIAAHAFRDSFLLNRLPYRQDPVAGAVPREQPPRARQRNIGRAC